MSLLSLLSFWACGPSDKAPVDVPAGFDWQGHRGARGLAPENTIPAFLKAMEYPALTTLELDLAVSKDSQLIVSHEPWFNPTICGMPDGANIDAKKAETLLIFQLSADSIRKFDCGTRPNPKFPNQERVAAFKPTLNEVIDHIKGKYPERFNQIRWNIEIKSQPEWDGQRHPPVATFAQLVVDALNRLGIRERTTVQSFDVRAIQAVHRIDSSISIALLVENLSGVQSNLDKLGFTPAIYSPYYQLISTKDVKKCHEKGIKVIPWTVNETPAMRKLIRMGVDGIITDYPNLIAQVSR